MRCELQSRKETKSTRNGWNGGWSFKCGDHRMSANFYIYQGKRFICSRLWKYFFNNFVPSKQLSLGMLIFSKRLPKPVSKILLEHSHAYLFIKETNQFSLQLNVGFILSMGHVSLPWSWPGTQSVSGCCQIQPFPTGLTWPLFPLL